MKTGNIVLGDIIKSVDGKQIKVLKDLYSVLDAKKVGDVVKEFISDDASVVVGTVIDPEMTDEMRVTVIVTGLSEQRARQASTPFVGSRARVAVLRSSDGLVDYQELERPAVMRKQVGGLKANKKRSVDALPDADYLDIPAFLRRHEEVES
jgi:cell division protein FtsZ